MKVAAAASLLLARFFSAEELIQIKRVAVGINQLQRVRHVSRYQRCKAAVRFDRHLRNYLGAHASRIGDLLRCRRSRVRLAANDPNSRDIRVRIRHHVGSACMEVDQVVIAKPCARLGFAVENRCRAKQRMRRACYKMRIACEQIWPRGHRWRCVCMYRRPRHYRNRHDLVILRPVYDNRHVCRASHGQHVGQINARIASGNVRSTRVLLKFVVKG